MQSTLRYALESSFWVKEKDTIMEKQGQYNYVEQSEPWYATYKKDGICGCTCLICSILSIARQMSDNVFDQILHANR
jgi:hypothetical protein